MNKHYHRGLISNENHLYSGMNVWSSLNETLICVNEILIVQTTSLGYIHAWNIISLAIFVWVSISSKICIDDFLIWIVHIQHCTHLCCLLWQTAWTFKSKRLHCASCAINIKKRLIKQYIPKINSKVCIYNNIFERLPYKGASFIQKPWFQVGKKFSNVL